jgi:hypothetical protein
VDFDFSEEQYLLRDTVRDLLAKESSPAQVRASWDSETGRSPERWRKLGEMGLLGLLIPEQYGGSGMDEVDMVLALEESGRSVLPEPLLESARWRRRCWRALDRMRSSSNGFPSWPTAPRSPPLVLPRSRTSPMRRPTCCCWSATVRSTPSPRIA